MLVQFGNNWMKKIPRTAKIGRGRRPSPIWLSEEFFSSNYFQIGQHVVLLHILIDLQVYLYSKPQAILKSWQQEQQLANTVENRRTVGRIRFS